MRTRTTALITLLLALVLPATAWAHEGASKFSLDHPAPSFVPGGGANPAFLSGGEGEWELLASIPTGNPHTDLDFFTQGGEMFLSAGTLAIGPNAGGQTIVQLTQDGAVDPAFVGAHPSAACLSDPAAALGLQHDVEATPKGQVLFNTDYAGQADTRDAQLLIDATDAEGRCHDQGFLGLDSVPRGGLEIIDITDPSAPAELVLTSHIGEAHTVNVDPRRPHIVYAVTSDGVGIVQDTEDWDGDGDTEELIRDSYEPDTTDHALDGFEILDISSCLDFPEGTDLQTKRDACRPLVYRWQSPLGVGQGTYNWDTQSGCHELEVYPNDLLACAAPDGTNLLDISGMFDDNGTPDDFTDDTVNGDPLPCAERASTSTGPFATGAVIIDCVNGQAGEGSLTIRPWVDAGAPSVAGIEVVGFAPHGGRAGGATGNHAGHSPAEDIAVSHEAELTHSGRFLLVSDERGGGVVPPDASCPTPGIQPAQGNGGVHAFAVDQLFTEYPGDPLTEDAETLAERSYAAYARTPDGDKAIFRATPKVEAGAFCTAHVFHQIPDQNRIFMAWYQQGTHVVDYVEHPDGTISFEEVSWFIPVNALEWTSAVFAYEENDDGSFTYYGAAADFNLGEAGRNTIDVWKVTLPRPAQMAADVAPPPAPEPAPQPAPEPEPEPSSLPATGGGIVLASLATLAGGVGLVRRRRG